MEKRTDKPSATYHAAALGLLALNKFPFGRVTATGLENVADRGAQILAYTHHNEWDVPAIGMSVYRHNRRLVHFWAKEELLDENKLTGRMLRSMHALPVRRGGPTKSQVRDADEVVMTGGLLALAAEGGRVNGDRVSDIFRGAGSIAIRNNVDVLPVAIAGENMRPQAKSPAYPRPLHVHFGEAIPVEGTGRNAREFINYQLGVDLQKALDTAYQRYEELHGQEAAARLDRGLTKLF
ncbi:MAG TPA: lysophospholipid acyltransferase family protein [Candidatus Saccharimonadales bacterium]|nr:lysophospholipid acyltransferase family protein [Candidatus Saccharimonadales bacterium]